MKLSPKIEQWFPTDRNQPKYLVSLSAMWGETDTADLEISNVGLAMAVQGKTLGATVQSQSYVSLPVRCSGVG
jgi:hypothetical protein